MAMKFLVEHLDFSQQYLQATLIVSLMSVWVLVGLFVYLNRYTKREYFTIWTAAWLFYALWLTLNLQTVRATDSLETHTAAHAIANAVVHQSKFEDIIFIIKQCCVAISAVF